MTESMTDQSNPASRLHTILQTLQRNNTNSRMFEIWVTVFELPQPPDAIEVTRHLIALSELLEDVKRLIEANPNLNHQKYLSGFPNIREVINPIYLNTAGQGHITGYVTTEVLTRLEFCDEELQKYYAEEMLLPEDLCAIVEATNELFEIVASTVQDVTLRVTLLEGLERVRIALALYRIHGAKGLKSSLQQLLGIVVTEKEAIKTEKEKNDDVILKLGKLLDKLDSFSAKALKVHKALKKPIAFLLSLVTEEDATNVGGGFIDDGSNVIEN